MTSNYTVICNTCNTKVDLTNRTNGINFDEYFLSCGHVQKIDKKEVFKDKRLSLDTQDEKEMINDPFDEKQATCDICGLTARSDDELENHKNNAHKTDREDNKRSTEQDIDPFP